MKLILRFLSILTLCSSLLYSQEQDNKSVFIDPEDGAIDLSSWLSKKAGFLPLVSIITEPAVGYGAGLNLFFFHTSIEEKQGPPSVSALVGGYTESDSWYAGGFHVGYWKGDDIRYVGALIKVDLNVDYFGQEIQLPNPLEFNIDSWILFQKLSFRIKDSPFFVGGQYTFLDADNTFRIPVDLPEFEGISFNSRVSELGAQGIFDIRDGVWSPEKGWYVETTLSYSDDWLGGDNTYGRFNFDTRWHETFGTKWLGAIRLYSKHSTEDVPFWVAPYVELRGVPAIKFQNRQATSIEGQVDFQISRRWWLDAFTGYGIAYKDFNSLGDGSDVVNYGTGFRYLMARQLKMKAGMDFGWSNDNDFAFYFVIGHQW